MDVQTIRLSAMKALKMNVIVVVDRCMTRFAAQSILETSLVVKYLMDETSVQK
jgi:hypothetical protein